MNVGIPLYIGISLLIILKMRQNTTKNGEDEFRRFCFNDTHDVDKNKFENLAADFNLFGNFY